MPEKMRALQYAESMTKADFKEMFCRVSGYIGNEAAYDPGKLCTMSEVSKLFDLLFNELIGDSETPAAGTAGESK